ncbi:nuclear transport factor 2 family protein [Priestia filamentosa]|uniref:Polyketide cyclase n=1 Tax=Priestia filamentosa TaxID=1402861 RepID=A0A1X7ELW0_9BACI|nr:nuclear transport factor 2 family protein [Priestia filamentosa]AKO93125.1 polyketide cyclase [Priestia filamentosa]MDT3763254.1 nuclear transport factor 2 family protein [Priestia filamentosa]OXS69760.1 polyketide cyclase [Priestia filamentosa]RJS63579.1 nuclear transport factor 2 family protein [Priestia filamentosa]WRU93723.1 nuclear transport factor 2 family protein [Priestia filamentosa]
MENLEKYFMLFDQSRTSEEAFEQLADLFTDDMEFVLNGYKQAGIKNWRNFVKMVYTENKDLKHMYQGWEKVQGDETRTYETRWAVCGKRASGEVYTQAGKDIAKLDEDGKITYLENVPDNTKLFQTYKKD